MAETVFYSAEPEQIQYMALPNGEADVWLRRNREQVDSGDGWTWQAEETYLHTTLTRDEVAANFDALFDGTYDPETATPTIEERVEALEEQVAAMQAAGEENSNG
ncbi:MAG: hypothetical protein LIO95_10770 [Clostridiales bacterium]|nr:hypothetical protein [Clostridiales bacterium]